MRRDWGQLVTDALLPGSAGILPASRLVQYRQLARRMPALPARRALLRGRWSINLQRVFNPGQNHAEAAPGFPPARRRDRADGTFAAPHLLRFRAVPSDSP